MRRFLCPDCGNQVHFNNATCLSCSSILAYSPSQDEMLAFPAGDPAATVGALGYSLCANRELIGCNWLCDNIDADSLCQSCFHTTKIPDISDLEKRQQWNRLERAKRRLFYALIKLNLPLAADPDVSQGSLRFELLGDRLLANGEKKRVMTGHDNGLITINIAEADDAIREKNRTMMGEPYRTLIGHFRHEVGHYYWDQLVDKPGVIERFRALFGDERRDYSEALGTYYDNGPPEDWQQSFVSAYATAHPWEDFAETWAHYLHMVSGLETAFAYGLNPQPLEDGAPPLVQLADPYHVADHEQLLDHWVPITVAMNAMNRSMGNRDYYPFVLSSRISEKLQFIHDLVKDQ
ncbi:zinc-binding metallopeptidase family protein [Parasphingorhabdus sp.]|uniref:zinc-binding metallopeptidase family protein n=1 Tax=Parasphingorhabdus sp. TaxID=2709688 RepID=UPI003A92B0F3